MYVCGPAATHLLSSTKHVLYCGCLKALYYKDKPPTQQSVFMLSVTIRKVESLSRITITSRGESRVARRHSKPNRVENTHPIRRIENNNLAFPSSQDHKPVRLHRLHVSRVYALTETNPSLQGQLNIQPIDPSSLCPSSIRLIDPEPSEPRRRWLTRGIKRGFSMTRRVNCTKKP